MTTFIDGAVKSIDERLQKLNDEMERLVTAQRILTDADREAAGEALAEPAKPTKPAKRRRGQRRDLTPKQVQALELIDVKPGMTGAELSRAMGGTYGYAAITSLQKVGVIEPHEGGGWRRKA